MACGQGIRFGLSAVDALSGHTVEVARGKRGVLHPGSALVSDQKKTPGRFEGEIGPVSRPPVEGHPNGGIGPRRVASATANVRNDSAR